MTVTQENSKDNFSGKVVLITGAGRGLGRSLVQAFSRQGAYVAANDLTPANLDETLRLARLELELHGSGDVQEFLGDISHKMAVQSLVLDILDHWERLDIVINNAAVRPKSSLLDMDEWDWRRTLDVNLSGPFFVTQIAGRVMRHQGSGVILNISDVLEFYPENLQLGAYHVTKAGLEALTRQAAHELAPYGVRVNALATGLLEGASLDEILADGEARRELVDAGKIGSVDEAARLALLLCGRQALTINGQVWRYPDGSAAPA